MTEARAGHGDPSFDRYARMLSRTLDAPIALVSLVEEGRQVFPGACGLPPDLAAVREWLDGGRTGPMLVDAKVVDTEPSWWLEEAFRGH